MRTHRGSGITAVSVFPSGSSGALASTFFFSFAFGERVSGDHAKRTLHSNVSNTADKSSKADQSRPGLLQHCYPEGCS